eukprot:TRINITY_DN2441_c0_g1_i4.p2 TRINITY_DN2441_c0_g1~~TRINITY_DN2441_c0_g1_i4.p2  ORF type:complete len:458 (+),score=42.65 TRINITY_DN2441_c0_g1_i4:2831-4204(+)
MSESSQKDKISAPALAFRPRTVRIAAKETTKLQAHNIQQRRLEPSPQPQPQTSKTGQQSQRSEKLTKQSEYSQQQSDKDHKEKQVYQYGNFPNYYDIRRNTDTIIDPRVMHLEREWFQGKSVLDIGCHRGHVSLQIARIFALRKLIGVDIDSVLIAKAVGSLGHFRRILRDNYARLLKQENRKKVIDIPKSNDKGKQSLDKGSQEEVVGDGLKSQKDLQGGKSQEQGIELMDENETKDTQKEFAQITQTKRKFDQVQISDSKQSLQPKQEAKQKLRTSYDRDEQSEQMAIDGENQLEQQQKLDQSHKYQDPADSNDMKYIQRAMNGLEHVQFVCEDIMNYDAGNEKFDVILCLSLVKWVHFHHGDDGVKSLFRYIGQIINRNGILLLEYQEFNTYKTDLKKCRGHFKYGQLDCFEFQPEQFVPFLISEVGFKQLECIQVDTENKTNYQRQIYVLQRS